MYFNTKNYLKNNHNHPKKTYHDICSAHCEPYSQSRLVVNLICNLCESVHNKLNLYNNFQVIYLFDYTCIYINWG
jgi:hypothetical protein